MDDYRGILLTPTLSGLLPSVSLTNVCMWHFVEQQSEEWFESHDILFDLATIQTMWDRVCISSTSYKFCLDKVFLTSLGIKKFFFWWFWLSVFVFDMKTFVCVDSTLNKVMQCLKHHKSYFLHFCFVLLVHVKKLQALRLQAIMDWFCFHICLKNIDYMRTKSNHFWHASVYI